MEGKSTIDEKPAMLYLHNARPPSRLSTPQPPDQMGFPSFVHPGMYGGHIAIPPVTMPIWGYPPNSAPQQGHYFGTPAAGNFSMPNTAAIVIPDIVAWFSFLDQHEQRNKDGITFAPYGLVLKAKGFLRLSQLTLDFIQLKDLQEWLSIEVGTAVLIMQYAKEDMEALKSWQWVFPNNLS
jgi:hypothetical protein